MGNQSKKQPVSGENDVLPECFRKNQNDDFTSEIKPF
jgi:hypothetical protein